MYMQNTRLYLMNKINSLLLLGLLFFSPALLALTEDLKKPVKIDANSVTFNKEKGYAVYEGGVSIEQGSLKIKAAKIEIFAPDNAISRIEAVGSPVSFEQRMDGGKLAKGKANKVRYLVKDKKLILSGGATLSQDKDTFTSPYIQYSIETGELKAGQPGKNDNNQQPRGRVKAIFYPAK